MGMSSLKTICIRISTRHAKCWRGDSTDSFVGAPAVHKTATMGFEPPASQHVDAVSGAIETLFESDISQKASRDDANQYTPGPAKVAPTAFVAGLHPSEFMPKVVNILNGGGG